MNNKLHWLFLAFFTVLTFTVSNAQETATLAVIERDGDTGTALVLVDLQTGTETVVLDDSFINTKPALSPNSRYIAFASNRDGNADYDLYLLEIQTQQIQQLTDHSGYEFDLDWSNDGSQIAYVAEVATGWQIRTINVFDLTVSQLVDSESNLFYPVWSPDDSQIAYVWRSGTARMIYSFGLNEMESHLLAIVDAYVYLRWSPDGSRLAFRGPGTNISVLDIASGQVQQITNEVEVLDYTWVNNSQLFYSETFSASYVINSDGTSRTEVVLPFAAEDMAFAIPKGATVPIVTAIPITLTPSPTPFPTTTPTPTPTATPTPASTQIGGGGQIAYDGGCTRPDGTGMLSAICGLNVSGGDTFYLTTGDDPALASGNRVAYVTNSGARFASGGVYMFDSDDQGSASTVVTSSGTYAEPAWSPDESKLAYAYRPNGSSTKYVVRTVNLDGSGVQTLTATSVNSRAPHWSAVSGKIVYHTDDGGDNEIWVMNADGSGKAQLTSNSADDRDPRWSPDGTQIVFASDRDGNYEIYRMNTDGSNVVRLTDNPVDDREPAWSLDGASAAFASNRLDAGSTTAGSIYRIYTLRASDGANVTQAAAASARRPDWGYIAPLCDPFGECTQSQTPPEE